MATRQELVAESADTEGPFEVDVWLRLAIVSLLQYSAVNLWDTFYIIPTPTSSR